MVQPTILNSIPPMSLTEKNSSVTTAMWWVNTQKRANTKNPSHLNVSREGSSERSFCNSLGINKFR